MLFTSVNFIIFFCACLGVKSIKNLSWERKKLLFIILSYYYYFTFVPSHVLLLFLFTSINYIFSFFIQRKYILILAIIVNLSFLMFYKYINFFVFELMDFQGIGSFQQNFFTSLVMPLGISFYVFEVISYHVDCHNKKFPVCKSIIDFFLYIAFFPRLASGPIIRAHEFFPQISQETYPDRNRIYNATFNILFGLFQKVVIADGILANMADTYQTPTNAAEAWTGLLSFSGQIFCDFNGYSLCAIGMANLLGISIPRNFQAPYTAILFSDFWRRWHISLSQWFRDYLYIPLGGNRYGNSRGFLNIFIVMTLCGLWHGASLTFIMWGVIHAVYLMLERALRIFLSKGRLTENKILTFSLWVFTLYCVNIAWVFFRQPDLMSSFSYLEKLHLFESFHISDHLIVAVVTYLIVILGQFAQRAYSNNFEYIKLGFLVWQIIVFWLVIFISIFAVGNINGFIYFQF